MGLFHPRSEVCEQFWVLKDISFVLEQGETVGFIGANGAGKSTALKLAAGIIEPDSGDVRVQGTLGALLELGAGFHPDLTGRENIYLNASILGLDRNQVRHKLDEIVAFAELERFIDMPVKHYSSGMYVRLGFAVAVHSDPEILLIDEVLSVGDQSFQHKCLDRISQLRRQGVTVVLVSHSLPTIQSFCDRAIWLDDGIVQSEGNTTDVAMDYLKAVARKEELSSEGGQASESARWGTHKVQIVDVELCDAHGRPSSVFATGESMRITLHYQADVRVERPVFGLAIHHQSGVHICGPNTRFGNLSIPFVEGQGVLEYEIPDLTLLEGTYALSVAVVEDLGSGETYDYHDRLYPFRVYRGKCSELYGLVTLHGKWHIDTHQDRFDGI